MTITIRPPAEPLETCQVVGCRAGYLCDPCHIERRRQRHREWAAAKYRRNARKFLDRERDRKYGLAPGVYDALLAKQGGACALCLQVKRLAVDHDHTTGKLRGLLCWRCNQHMRGVDEPEWLERALRYRDDPPHKG